MKIGQLIEYKMRNKSSLGPFFEKSRLSISLDQQSEILFSLYAQVDVYQNMLN